MHAIKLKALSAISFAGLLGAVSVAQAAENSQPFQGFYGQIATGYESNGFQNTSTRYTNSIDGAFLSNGQNTATHQTASGVPLILGLGYNFSISRNWLLGLGADFSLLSQTTGAFSATNQAFPQASQTTGQKIQTSNRINAFLSAGYALTQQDLLYAKVGYSNQQLQFSRPAQDSSTGFSSQSNQQGYVLGIGYKKIIEGGLYVYAEANYMQYAKRTLSGASVTQVDTETVVTRVVQHPSANAITAIIGLGYRF